MTHLARHLALAACLTLIGSVADAAPHKRGKVAKAKVQHDDDRATLRDADDDRDPEDDEEDDDEEEETVRHSLKVVRVPAFDWRKRARERRLQKKYRVEQVGFVDDSSDSDRESNELVDAPVLVPKKRKGLRDWNVAVGPNVWIASVDANVAVGAKGVGTAIDFLQLSRQTKYGVPVLIEARYKRFSFVADVLLASVGINSAPKEIGPLMVKVDATVTTLLVDGLFGYRIYGGDDALLTVEGRAGIRYQRTAISGSIGLSGNGISPPEIVQAGGDVLAGARVTVRPFSRLAVAGTVDRSLFGNSTSTYSLGAEVNVRVTGRILLVAGYRTLTQQKAEVSTVMHGPRGSVQLLF